MAKQIEAGKFLIIECTAVELYTAGGGPGICDSCATPSGNGYYIAVLNCWFCPACYERWKSTARYYPQDAEIERRNFEFYARHLGLKIE